MRVVDSSACAYDSDKTVHTWSQATESEAESGGRKGNVPGDPYDSN